MMKMNEFIDVLLARAVESGLEAAEVYCQETDRFRAMAMNGSVDDYQVSTSCGLSLRGTVNGKMGYASTQAFDEAAIEQLINGVKESAALVDAPEQDEIFAGEKEYPVLEEPETDLHEVTADEKLACALALCDAVTKADERIVQATHPTVSTVSGTTTLRNTYGLNLSYTENVCFAYVGALARRGEGMTDGFYADFGRKFSQLDPAAIANEAARRALVNLDATSVEAGEYRIIFDRESMCDLLQTFSGVFSAKAAQERMSLLGGKEGTEIAAPIVTLMDDPLLPGGYESRPFDAEGSASVTKAVIENGVLKTLLHNRSTARKQGVTTTGNASRPDYASSVTVAPTNMFFKPGTKTLAELMADMGDGLVITEVSGLHAGANPTSGDFSLLAKGYTVEGGKRGHAVEQITVAGNFYQVLKNIRAIGSDLFFPGSGIGSPSVDVGTLVVSGQ
ncbi:MAG: TldD/PmbA family protein [Clostridia bacterium]|nr:TldD/PmbA family protein [Clostridia bacterium]